MDDNPRTIWSGVIVIAVIAGIFAFVDQDRSFSQFGLSSLGGSQSIQFQSAR
ncbi:MAG: hypothetical protein AAF826_03985 [Pseudomonadota bacterium]